MQLHASLYERSRDRQREERRKMKAEIRVMQPEVKEHWSHQKLEEARHGFSSGAPGRSVALPEFGLLASRTLK